MFFWKKPTLPRMILIVMRIWTNVDECGLRSMVSVVWIEMSKIPQRCTHSKQSGRRLMGKAGGRMKKEESARGKVGEGEVFIHRQGEAFPLWDKQKESGG